jgi:Luciferase-like monooxygenase
MTEQAGPQDLVRWAVRAEDVGFDLLVSSDHYLPWVDEQGHAPNAWVMLGTVAQVTERAELMTYVTCPTMRYHPAVVAQQAATLALLSGDRFTLGLGSGENLNEHVIGGGCRPGPRGRSCAAPSSSPTSTPGPIRCGPAAGSGRRSRPCSAGPRRARTCHQVVAANPQPDSRNTLNRVTRRYRC